MGVVTTAFARARIGRDSCGREHELPFSFLGRPREFAFQGGGHLHLAEPCRQVGLVKFDDAIKMFLEHRLNHLREHGAAVFIGLTFPYDNLLQREVNVFDAEP